MRFGRVRTFIVAAALAATAAYAADEMAGMGDAGMGDMLPHPFLSHMGIPDQPGSVSIRAAVYRQGRRGEDSWTDGAFHLEAGLLPRLGVHLRSDAVMQDPRLDVMAMFAVWRDAANANGVSAFAAGEVAAGTVPAGERDVESAFGVSGRKSFGAAVTADADFHYMPTMKMFEYEAAAVASVHDYFYPAAEFSGEYMLSQEGMPATNSSYALAGLKFRLKGAIYVGVGYQFGVTADREFDNRALLQLDTDW